MAELEHLPPCPMVGCSHAFLVEFIDRFSVWNRASVERSPDYRDSERSRVSFQEGGMDAFTSTATPTTPTEESDSSISSACTTTTCTTHQDVRTHFMNFISESMLADADIDLSNMDTVCTTVIKPCTRPSPQPPSGRATGSRTPEPDKIKTPPTLPDEKVMAMQAAFLLRPGAAQAPTDQDGLSFAEVGSSLGIRDTRGNPAFARATHFVSHAWKCDFGSLVKTLGQWLEQNSITEDTVYFWIDAFAINQHSTQKYPQLWWSTRFMQVVGDVGNTILVLDPWEEPVPFMRTWVIWELYCTSVTGARLHVAMSEQCMADFMCSLQDSFERVVSVLSRLDVSKSSAFNKHDQDMIQAEICRSIGFAKLNEFVQARLLLSLVDIAKLNLQKMHLSDFDGLKYFQLKDNIARMLRERGRLRDAELLFVELQEETEEKLGRDHAVALECLNQLAVTLQKSNRPQEALIMHRDCLFRRQEVMGFCHEATFQSASNLACLLSEQPHLSQDSFDEARRLYRLALAGREASLGKGHPRTVYTMSNLGKLLSEAPTPRPELSEEAEALHARARELIERHLQETHPLTLTVMHNQARHWLRRADAEGDEELSKHALAQLARVHSLRMEKLGEEHPDTLLTEDVLRKCQEKMELEKDDKIEFEHFGYHETWAEISGRRFPQLHTAQQFLDSRELFRRYGLDRLRSEMVESGHVDYETGALTLDMQPFNVFARIASGVHHQLTMTHEQDFLGPYQEKYVIACNKVEADENWASDDPAWVGKASMSKRHVFLLTKDTQWEWFNVLTVGMCSGLRRGVEVLKEMREAALQWLREKEGWPTLDRIGLYLHVYTHLSVKAMHMHIVDMDHLGPTFHRHAHKNLPIDAAIEALEEELSQGMLM